MTDPNVLLAAAVNLDQPGHSLHWSIFTVSEDAGESETFTLSLLAHAIRRGVWLIPMGMIV